MPGQLRPDAKCPICGDGLLCLTDTSNYRYIFREYDHTTNRPTCHRQFTGDVDRHLARVERNFLETVPTGATRQ